MTRIPEGFVGLAERMREADYGDAAEKLHCEVAAIKAVAEVESEGRSGFLPDGRPVILLEAHYFSRLTDHQFDRTHPNISSRRWNRHLYRGGAEEYDRLEAAMGADRLAALRSCSWGMFQVMGANWNSLGYPSVEMFVAQMCRSEGAHLDAMVRFCVVNKLDDELRERRWADFARVYNGRGYKANRYDEKLADAYWRFSTTSTEGPATVWPSVLEIQRALNGAGAGIEEDGIRGPETRAAVLAFQRREGLVMDGIVGQQTLRALGFDV